MAVYKVLQDIEAEDKLIAWLTPKQTIFAAIVIVSGILAFVMGRVNPFLAVPWIIPITIFGFLAAPLGRDQPNDVWLAAQIRFFLKQRKRVWDQSGMEELVRITVPKREEKHYTDGLSQTQVRSRLSALASTIDSRGWAVKNSALNVAGSNYQRDDSSDRLVAASNLPQELPISDVTDADDILDATNNAVAQRFDTEIKKKEVEQKQQLRQKMTSPTNTPTSQDQDFYFLREQAAASSVPAQQAPSLATFQAQVVTPGAHTDDNAPAASAVDEESKALLEKIHHDQELQKELLQDRHEKRIKTPAEVAEEQRQAAEAEKARQQAITQKQQEMARKQASDAIIKELSQNSDFSVATLASEAKRKTDDALQDGAEISLH